MSTNTVLCMAQGNFGVRHGGGGGGGGNNQETQGI